MNTIILAGGKSSRMGQNKALMEINGVRVIDRLIAELNPISEKIIVIANDHSPYKQLNVAVIQDPPEFQGHGPLAGIYAGLTAVHSGPSLVVACDLPFASQSLALHLFNIMKEIGCDAVIPTTAGYIHPLFAMYDPQIAGKIKATLNAGQRAVRAILANIQVEYVQIDNEMLVWNMNTIADYEKAIQMVGRRENDEL